MKKLLTLALAAIMCAGSAKALDYVPEPGFTFQGFFGMNISNFRYTDSLRIVSQTLRQDST